MYSSMETTRRRFLELASTWGVASSLFPGVLWARVQEQPAGKVTPDVIRGAAALVGLEFTEDQERQMVAGLNRTLDSYANLRAVKIHDSVAPPMYYSPVVPGLAIDRTARPKKWSKLPDLRRPANLEDVAFWPILHLAHLVRTRQVRSSELTDMYLSRLRKHNAALNCVVTFTDDLARKQAAEADREIAAGRYRGPLHGIPWGCKDIIAVPGYPTTWGSDAFKTQVIDQEATVVRLLREAGAVLLAKLATGELAGGDQWFGGRTNNPWDPKEGSSGSSAGPAAATAAGLVAFGIGTETSGSILSPATMCGVTGLRPTFGRVSRHGAMTLSWTQDRIGPLCRTVEDTVVVLSVIARTDENDLSVQDIPFNWDASIDVRKLKVGYLDQAFAEESRHADWKANDQKVLDVLRSLGVSLVPFQLPALPLNAVQGVFGAESGASFDEFVRSGRDQNLTNKNRGNGFRSSRFIPAIEYLQAQRVRMLIMQDLARAVAPFDAWVAPYLNIRGMGGPGQNNDRSPTFNHFSAANLCGYPAVSLLNGFTTDGKTTSITFLARPFAEAPMLALARAYQDATEWVKRHPVLT